MSTFYVLPSRSVIGNQIARMLQKLLPGLTISGSNCVELLHGLLDGTEQDCYLVHREDLPDDHWLEALESGFGAVPGDRVVQISLGILPDQPRIQSWILGGDPSAEPVASSL